MNNIQFEKRNFQIREISLPGFGDVLISTNRLNKLLINEAGGYVSEEAQSIDEKIFYFVNENELKLKYEKLIHLVSKQVL